MTARFTVLASGSSGNATLLEVGGFGLLIDCGLNPRMLSARLAAVGASWEKVHAVILTHTHGDHWKDLTLAQIGHRQIPVYAHPAHLDHLSAAAPAFDPLHRAALTRTYAAGRPLMLAPGLVCRPLWVSHDSDPTFAFRIDHAAGDGTGWSVGYASDLGCWSDDLAGAFAGVDVLAVEFNHDEQLELGSRRPAFLVQRVLGDSGHLSNRQAAEFTRAVLAHSAAGVLGHVVQLHLSRDCNRPELAAAAAKQALAPLAPEAQVVTARQDVVTRGIPLVPRPTFTRRAPRPVPATSRGAARISVQPRLPGFDAG